VSVYQVRALSYLLPGGNREDRQTVDSRERRRPTPYVHVLGGKYLLYSAGSYNSTETLPSRKIPPEALAHLSKKKQKQLLAVLDKYPECFSDTLGIQRRQNIIYL